MSYALDAFGMVQPSKGQVKIDSLYFNDVDYVTIIHHQLVLRKNFKDVVRKLNECRLMGLVNHILTSNFRSISKLAIIKKMIEKHKKFY